MRKVSWKFGNFKLSPAEGSLTCVWGVVDFDGQRELYVIYADDLHEACRERTRVVMKVTERLTRPSPGDLPRS